MTARFVDTHTHIQGEDFVEDLDDVVGRAMEAGVDRLVIPGVDLESSRAAIAVAERHPGAYATAGFHPHEASRLDDVAFAEVDALLQHPRVVAVGEIGLDYFYEHSPREAQLACIDRMLTLATQHTLPVIVHCRDAWEDTSRVLEPWARDVRERFEGRPLGVIHYFSGTLEQAQYYIDLGFLISVHTFVTHKKQTAMREIVAKLPLESLVIETDAPHGSPQVVRGKRNEPAYVVEAAKQIATEQGRSLEEVASATSANAARLFSLPAEGGTT